MHEQPADKPLSRGELMIVAVILAILSAILVPQYSRASGNDSGDNAAMPAELRNLRGKIAAYRRTHDNQLPAIFYCGGTLIDGDGVWSELTGSPLANPLNGLSSVRLIDSSADDLADGSRTYGIGHTTPAAGWIVNTATCRVWATAANPRNVFNEADPQAPANFAR